MPFSAYDSEAIRLLSTALKEVLAQADQLTPAADVVAFDRAVTRKLIEAYDGGERDLEALKRAGVAGVRIPARWMGLDT